MKKILAFYRRILSLRYKLNISGKNILKLSSPKLFLPNHQAHVDAQLITTYVFKYSSFIPIVSARFFKTPILKGIFKQLKAVPVSNIQSGKVEKELNDKAVEIAVNILKNGDNVLIYPSGQLAGQGIEKIFNPFQNCPYL